MIDFDDFSDYCIQIAFVDDEDYGITTFTRRLYSIARLEARDIQMEKMNITYCLNPASVFDDRTSKKLIP